MPGSEDRRLRVLTWNVARRVSVIADQAAAIAARAPDVVALQEVTRRTLPIWRSALEIMGLPHVRTSLADPPSASAGERPRRMGVLLASRAALRDVRHGLVMPWHESALCAVTDTPTGAVEIFTVHVPNAANGWVKPDSLRAVRAGLRQAGPGRRMLCGDLNTPRRELPDGGVISFARDSRGRLRPERGPEWDEAELGVVPGLRELGYQDAFRSLHGYGTREPSRTWSQIAGHGSGWRLEHIFVSLELRPVGCSYPHDWRERALSDHSALEADVVAADRRYDAA